MDRSTLGIMMSSGLLLASLTLVLVAVVATASAVRSGGRCAPAGPPRSHAVDGTRNGGTRSDGTGLH